MRWRLRTLLLGFAIASLALAGGRFAYRAVGPIFPRQVYEKLRPGMSKAEVQAIIGPPTSTYGADDWRYERKWNPGWVEVQFNEAGRLLYVNDESIDRP